MSDELALSERHDAAGRHDDAVNALAKATQAGNVEAMTLLGKRLIVGDRAPCLPQDGVGLLVDAAKKGSAEAIMRLAVLSATGAYMKQSWTDAITLLSAAAERGCEPAQRQLRVLCADRELAAQDADKGQSPADFWQLLARGIDIAHWTAAADCKTLHESPLVRTCPAFIPGRLGRWLIDQSQGKLGRATVYDAVRGEDTTHEIRTNRAGIFNLMQTDLVHSVIQARMSATCGVTFHNLEAPAILHYEVGEQIGEHYDFVDPRTPSYAQEIELRGQRVITFLVYLNDGYEGGNTCFPKLGLSHHGRLGEGLYFVNALSDGSPDLRTVHAGEPPTSGTKWILSQFIRDRQVLGTGDRNGR